MEEQTKLPKDNWKLSSIKIDFMTYGENKGKYEGKITFDNGEYESFTFKIRPDMAERYINLMAADIVTSANELGERLIESLGLAKK
jgi:hypothetical protein